ncbi:11346_t:CDS:10, partial [Entrophospora sp. SA101]
MLSLKKYIIVTDIGRNCKFIYYYFKKYFQFPSFTLSSAPSHIPSKNDVASENVKNGIGVGDNRLSNLPYNEKENGGFNKLTSTVAGLVKPGKYEDSGFDPKEWLDPGDERKMALFTQYAICAAKQALFDAEWISISDDDKEKTGVCIGSGIGSFQDIIDTSMIYKEHACKSSFYDYGAHKVNPMFIPRVLINMAAGHLSLKYGFHGPNHSVSTACTTGAHSIGDASRFIQFGDADVMIAATKFNDNPKEASRPFDKDRNGFVISEGAGMLVLEEYHHAISRGARIYAEICGYGLSGDAYHMTAPHENGHGAKLAMIRSLNHSKILPKDIDYINTHATSTLIGDVAEIKAIHSLFHSK